MTDSMFKPKGPEVRVRLPVDVEVTDLISDESTIGNLRDLYEEQELDGKGIMEGLKLIGDAIAMIQDGKILPTGTIRQQIACGFQSSADCKVPTVIASEFLLRNRIPHYVVAQLGKTHPNIIMQLQDKTYWLNYTFSGLTSDICRYAFDETEQNFDGDCIRQGLEGAVEMDKLYLDRITNSK